MALLKAIHTRGGGLMPASIHVFEAGWCSRLTVRVVPPAVQEGHPMNAIPAEYTCVLEGL